MQRWQCVSCTAVDSIADVSTLRKRAPTLKLSNAAIKIHVLSWVSLLGSLSPQVLGGSHWCINDFIACPPATMSLPSAMMLLVFILCASATALASDQSSGDSTLRLTCPSLDSPPLGLQLCGPSKASALFVRAQSFFFPTSKLCSDGLCIQRIAAASICIVPTKEGVRAQSPAGHVGQCAKASSEGLQRLAAEHLIVKDIFCGCAGRQLQTFGESSSPGQRNCMQACLALLTDVQQELMYKLSLHCSNCLDCDCLIQQPNGLHHLLRLNAQGDPR